MTAVDIVVRDIHGQAEMRAVEELQKEVWGLPDLDVVPVTQLAAAQASGGVLLGAFDADLLIGFAYGFTGFEHGGAIHHSHMLGVKRAYREHGVGFKLKLAQREHVLAQGINVMTWTFDPLQSMNAFFNFGRLGVKSDRYLIDFYGSDAASFLHRNGTDRLWVTWPLNARRVLDRIAKPAEGTIGPEAEALVEAAFSDLPRHRDVNYGSLGDTAFIEIPTRIADLERSEPDVTAEWRRVTRMAFTNALAAGFVVADFVRGAKFGRYLLSRSETMATFSE